MERSIMTHPIRRSPGLSWFLAVPILTTACVTPAFAAVACESLVSKPVADGVITAAREVPAGQFKPAQGGPPTGKEIYASLPAFCLVDASLKPVPDSETKIEVWLPEANWNGKLVEGGNGGYGNTFSYSIMAQALKDGFAATSSNTGHDEAGNSAAFVMDHPEKLIDWGYRAVHENAEGAKAVAAAYYGDPVKVAYFDGCSTGGRQAYGEAERYPADFDGIIAGDPGINTTHQTAMQTWMNQQAHLDPAASMPAEKYTMLHNAVINACDALDGVKDGVIENPLQCHFDPGTLLCKAGDAPDCLTAPQVEFVRKVYAGPVSPKGVLIFPGFMPGSEMGWFNLAGGKPIPYAVDTYKYLTFKNPDWDYMTLDLDRDVPYADKVAGPTINNADPNIKPFFARGGKLLAYHGWADAGVPPLSSINYRESVAKLMGGIGKIDSEYRLFMVPGMAHCGGGDGTSTFDLIPVLDAWKTTGKAPDSIVASRERNGKVDRTRPLCPYPKQAVYKGTGSTDDAANFACAVRPGPGGDARASK